MMSNNQIKKVPAIIKERACPICEKQDKTDVTWILKDERFMKSELSKIHGPIRNHIELSVCNFCQLVYYSKYIELSDMYKDEYRNNIDFLNPSRMQENNIKIFLWVNLLKNILNLMPNGEILDIGCSEGFWVQYLKSRGFIAEGLEINKKSLVHGRKQGLTIYDYDILKHNKKYNFVFNSGYLEHVHNPKQVLEHIRDYCLYDNGYLYIGTPNVKCPNNKYLSEYFAPEHYQTFSTETLQNLLYSCGFKVLQDWRDVYNFGLAILAQKTDFRNTEPLQINIGMVSQLTKLKLAHDQSEPITPFLGIEKTRAKAIEFRKDPLNGNISRAEMIMSLLVDTSPDMALRIYYKLDEFIKRTKIL